MAPHESNQASLDDKGHDEKYKAAQAELARAVELGSNKANEIKAIRRKATQQNLRVEAKKAKIAKLSGELHSAQSELLNAQSEESQMRRDLQAAGAAHAELSLTREIKEAALETVGGKALRCEENFDAATNNISAVTPEMKDTLSAWANNFFQTSSGCLVYPTAKRIFLSTKGDLDKEASGIIQRINNPMYLTDRIVYFMTNKFLDTKRPESGHSRDTDYMGVSRRLWLMMDSQFDRLIDAPEQVLLAVVLSRRMKIEVLNAQRAVGAPISMMDTKDRAVLELIKELKSAQNEPVHTDDTELGKKILATARMGKYFREIAEYYGHCILVVLPLTELFKFARTQRADSFPMETLHALVKLLIHQDAALMRALKLIVSLLNNWIDHFGFKFSVKAGRVNDEKQFMVEMGQLREPLGLPATSFTLFSPVIDIEPTDRWELLASVSGWDIAYDTDLVVFKDNPKRVMTVDPHVILGDILGQYYTCSGGNFKFEHPTDIQPDTMSFLLRLLRSQTDEGAGCPMLVLDLRGSRPISIQDMAKSRGWTKAAVCVVRLGLGWVVIRVPKPEAGGRPFSEALVLVHEDGSGASTEICTEVASGLGLLDQAVKISHVNVTQPQRCSSGIHALCHALALHNVGHHWVNELSDHHIMDIRHALLRAATIAFIHAANAEKAQEAKSRVDKARAKKARVVGVHPMQVKVENAEDDL